MLTQSACESRWDRWGRPVLRQIGHILLVVTYGAIAAALAGTFVATAGWGLPISLAMGGLFFVSCGLLHVALSPRGGKTSREMRSWMMSNDVTIDQLRKDQADTRADVDAIARAFQIEVMRRNEKLTRDMVKLEQLVLDMGTVMQRSLSNQTASAPQSTLPPPRSDSALLDAVREALEDNRVELHLQPIVTLPQRRVAFYESFSRLRDPSGSVILPSEFLRVAENSGLVAEIDNLLLFRCVQIARRMVKQDRRIALFCNISTASLSDDVFFPQFIGFLKDNRDLASSLIFELGRRSFESIGPVAERNLGRLFDLGFRFSLDRCESVDLDLRTLERAGIRYVKVPGTSLAQSLRDGDRPITNVGRDVEPRDVVALFTRYGIELIADRIEDERIAIEVLELDVAYGQGNLFGAPRAIKETAYEERPLPKQLRGAS